MVKLLLASVAQTLLSVSLDAGCGFEEAQTRVSALPVNNFDTLFFN